MDDDCQQQLDELGMKVERGEITYLQFIYETTNLWYHALCEEMNIGKVISMLIRPLQFICILIMFTVGYIGGVIDSMKDNRSR
jgi:hypothetical protein